jgi:hypothetical protein
LTVVLFGGLKHREELNALGQLLRAGLAAIDELSDDIPPSARRVGSAFATLLIDGGPLLLVGHSQVQRDLQPRPIL